jgi:hypothetical protein
MARIGRKAKTVGAIFAVDAVALLLFAGILRWI